MAEKLDPRQVVTFEELLRSMMYEQEATRRVLVRKGLLTNEEVLEEIKVVRREAKEVPTTSPYPARFPWSADERWIRRT